MRARTGFWLTYRIKLVAYRLYLEKSFNIKLEWFRLIQPSENVEWNQLRTFQTNQIIADRTARDNCLINCFRIEASTLVK